MKNLKEWYVSDNTRIGVSSEDSKNVNQYCNNLMTRFYEEKKTLLYEIHD